MKNGKIIRIIVSVSIFLVIFFFTKSKNKKSDFSKTLIRDIGAERILYVDRKTIQGNSHINWISFPDLFEENKNITDIPRAKASKIFSKISPHLPPLILFSQFNANLEYDGCSWSNIDYLVNPVSCYQLVIPENRNFYLPQRGSGLPQDYVIHMNPNENWVGFWIRGSVDWSEALGKFKDKFVQIRAENWVQTKTDFGWIGPSDCTFTYGKGYIFYVSPKDYPNGFDFHWQEASKTDKRIFIKEKTKNFTYREKRYYDVIDILEIEDAEKVTEIGAFVNGVCVGASEVKECPVQILAYTKDLVGADGGKIYFKIASDNGIKENHNIFVYKPALKEFKKSELISYGFGYHLIKLGKSENEEYSDKITLSLTNYPDVFEFQTEINFTLPKNQKITLSVYNSKGKKVKTLLKGKYPSGSHKVIWYGKDDSGDMLSGGLYVCKLITEQDTLVSKMLLIKK